MKIQKDAFPELDRVKKFFPLGVENPQLLTKTQIDRYNDQGYLLSGSIGESFGQSLQICVRVLCSGVTNDSLLEQQPSIINGYPSVPFYSE